MTHTLEYLLPKKLTILLSAAALSACGGATGPITVAPITPAVTVIKSLQNMTGKNTLTGNSSMLILRNNSTKMYFGNGIDSTSTIIVDQDTGSTRLVMTHTTENAENISIDESFTAAQTIPNPDEIMNIILAKAGTVTGIGADHVFELQLTDPDTKQIPKVNNVKYVSGGLWIIADNEITSDYEVGYSVAGLKTVTSSMPTTGTAEYDIFSDGILLTGTGVKERRVQGIGTLTAAFATGNISVNTPTLNVTNMETDVLIGIETGYSMSGSMTADLNDFTGTVSRSATNTDPALTGVFNGSFYGPSADEVGAAFQMGSGGNNTATNSSIVGGFVGKK